MKLEERFWKKVDKTTTPDGCWEWLGANTGKQDYQYGQMTINGERRMATHVSWELQNEQAFPAGKIACHTCNNPSCVRPDHIYLGNQKTNMQDAVRAGHLNHEGELNSRAKLTREQAQFVRTSELTYRKLAGMFGVSTWTIRNIRKNISWKEMLDGKGI